MRTLTTDSCVVELRGTFELPGTPNSPKSGKQVSRFLKIFDVHTGNLLIEAG
jgi:hypothetical protein